MILLVKIKCKNLRFQIMGNFIVVILVIIRQEAFHHLLNKLQLSNQMELQLKNQHIPKIILRVQQVNHLLTSNKMIPTTINPIKALKGKM